MIHTTITLAAALVCTLMLLVDTVFIACKIEKRHTWITIWYIVLTSWSWAMLYHFTV